MRQLKFPSYEYIKSLPVYDEDTDTYREYTWTLFETPVDVYGRFSYNEDGEPYIFFDVMEGSYCEKNQLGMCVDFNRENYIKLCEYAQKVFESFYKELDEDLSSQWEELII